VRRLTGVALIAAAAVALLLAYGPPARTATRTLALLPELLELPVRPLSALVPEPRRLTTTYGAPSDRLDIYLPHDAVPDATRPAVILALGIHPQPIDHRDVVRIASAIGRLGVVVGVPDSSALRATRVTPGEAAHLAEAVLAVRARPEVDPARVGLAGFSAGASIALIAAADPRIAPGLRLVSGFGGYADAETLLVDVASRSTLLDGEVTSWQPDAGILRDVRALFQQASDDPQATEALFTAADRQAAAAVIAATPARLRADLAAISPTGFVERVEARVYLLHGDNDSAIPVAHGIALADALGDRVVRFTRFGRFQHGQPGRNGLSLADAQDIWALTLWLHDVVAAATE
jgi:dienelactone hydrolase